MKFEHLYIKPETTNEDNEKLGSLAQAAIGQTNKNIEKTFEKDYDAPLPIDDQFHENELHVPSEFVTDKAPEGGEFLEQQYYNRVHNRVTAIYYQVKELEDYMKDNLDNNDYDKVGQALGLHSDLSLKKKTLLSTFQTLRSKFGVYGEQHPEAQRATAEIEVLSQQIQKASDELEKYMSVLTPEEENLILEKIEILNKESANLEKVLYQQGETIKGFEDSETPINYN